MANFLETMKSADDLENEIAEKEGRPVSSGYHGIFSTHPSTENRIEAMNQTESSTGIKNRDEFLKMINLSGRFFKSHRSGMINFIAKKG